MHFRNHINPLKLDETSFGSIPIGEIDIRLFRKAHLVATVAGSVSSGPCCQAMTLTQSQRRQQLHIHQRIPIGQVVRNLNAMILTGSETVATEVAPGSAGLVLVYADSRLPLIMIDREWGNLRRGDIGSTLRPEVVLTSRRNRRPENCRTIGCGYGSKATASAFAIPEIVCHQGEPGPQAAP